MFVDILVWETDYINFFSKQHPRIILFGVAIFGLICRGQLRAVKVPGKSCLFSS